MSIEAYACEYRPTLKERIARRLGFRFVHGEDPEHADSMEGWAKTRVCFNFTMADRIRLLFSGSLRIDLTHYTDKPFDVMKTRTDFIIKAPWDRS